MQTPLMEVINPTADRELKVGKIAPRAHDLEAKRIGFLDNSKPNADRFLDEIRDGERKRRYSGAVC